ncbi:UNVERIFIED_CONTAM: hypothetical protein O8I53_08060 [Campylobacter lari]
MFSLFKSVANTKIVDDIIDNIFNTMKEVKKYGQNGLKTALLEAMKKGALAFISNEKGEISISRIFQQIPIFKSIFNNIDTKSYVEFINLLFESTPININEGIFSVPFGPKNDQSSVKVDVGFSGI